MTEQQHININTRPLNEGETVKNARQALYKYREYLLQVNDEYLPKVTPSYSLEAVSTANEYNGSTEKVIAYLDEQREREFYMKQVAEAVNRLPVFSRKIIIMQYLMRETTGNRNMQAIVDLSEVHFFRMKKAALIDFAKALKIAVYQTE